MTSMYKPHHEEKRCNDCHILLKQGDGHYLVKRRNGDVLLCSFLLCNQCGNAYVQKIEEGFNKTDG